MTLIIRLSNKEISMNLTTKKIKKGNTVKGWNITQAQTNLRLCTRKQREIKHSNTLSVPVGRRLTALSRLTHERTKKGEVSDLVRGSDNHLLSKSFQHFLFVIQEVT